MNRRKFLSLALAAPIIPLVPLPIPVHVVPTAVLESFWGVPPICAALLSEGGPWIPEWPYPFEDDLVEMLRAQLKTYAPESILNPRSPRKP